MTAPASFAAPPPQLEAAGRAQRSVATWLTSIGATAAVSLAGFFATPYLVRWLGDTSWGAWAVIGEWLGYLGLGQLALGPGVLTIFLLRARTSPDPQALTAMAKRGLRLYLRAAVVLAPAALMLTWWTPRGLHATAAFTPTLYWAVGIASLGSLALAPPLLFRSVLETVQRGYRVRIALLIQSLLITGLSLWWVGRGGGLIAMAAASVAGMAVGAALWCGWARRWLPAWRRTASARLPGREVWRLLWPLMLALLGNQVNQLTDNTVVGLALGPAAVAAFALTQSLPLLAGGQITEIGAVSWAALGELRARKDHAFQHRIVELSATVLGCGTVLAATVACFTPAFVNLWVGARHFDGGLLVWATAACTVVFSFLCFFSWLIDTQGDTRRRLAVSSLGAGLNLTLSLVLVRYWGVAGVALGTLLAYLCTDAWFLPYLAVRHYGVPAAELGRALAGALGRGSAWAMAAVAVLPHLPQAHSWPLLLAEMGASGGAAGLYCWRAVLRPADRAAWRGRFASFAGSQQS